MRISLKNYNEYKRDGGELCYAAWEHRILEMRKERRRQKIRDWQRNNRDKLRGYARTYRANHSSSGNGRGVGKGLMPVYNTVDEDLREKYGDRANRAQVLRDLGSTDEKIEQGMVK